MPGQQPPGEPVADDDRRAQPEQRLDRARHGAEQQRRRHQRDRVERDPLRVGDRGALRAAPSRPTATPSRPAGRARAAATHAHGERGSGETMRRDHEQRAGGDPRPQPRLVEVPAGEERERGRPGQRERPPRPASRAHLPHRRAAEAPLADRRRARPAAGCRRGRGSRRAGSARPSGAPAPPPGPASCAPRTAARRPARAPGSPASTSPRRSRSRAACRRARAARCRPARAPRRASASGRASAARRAPRR